MKLPKFMRNLFGTGDHKPQKSRLAKEYIRCPQCETLYALYSHVSFDNLEAVNCGTCATIFNGLENRSQPRSKIKISTRINPFQPRLSRLVKKHKNRTLLETKIISSNEIEKSSTENVTPHAEQTYSNIILETTLEDTVNEIPDINIHSVEKFIQQTEPVSNDTILKSSPQEEKIVSLNELPAQQLPMDILFSPLQNSESGHIRRPLGWIYAVIALLIASNLLMGGILWINQETLAQNSHIRPWLMIACEYLSCTLPAYSDPSKIIVQQHQLATNPDDPNRLQLHALIQNTSSFAQKLTNLQMSIDNLQGQLVNTILFSPEQYAQNNPNFLLEPGKTLHISVNITQPSSDIFSYELKFI